jgi:hypothetical protein
MIRKTEKRTNSLNMVNYKNSFFQKYKDVCHKSLYNVSKQNGFDPFEFNC